MLAHLATAALSAVYLAPACAVFGSLAQLAKLPQITGFLVAGVVAGPYVLGLLTDSSIQDLWYVDQICLGVIVTAAGAELQLHQLEKIKKQVLIITAAISLFSWAFVFAAVLLLSPLLTVRMSASQAAIVASLAATLAMARSPASAMAVLTDTGGRGSFCALVMAVVIVKDVLTIVAFSLNIEIARTLLGRREGGSASMPVGSGANADGWNLALGHLAEPFTSVVVAVAIGVGASTLLSGWMRLGQLWPARTAVHSGIIHPGPGISSNALSARLPATQRIVKAVGLLCVTTFVFEVAAALDAEPLLACAVTGLLTNHVLKGTDREEMHHGLDLIMPYVNLAFFSLAGASLRLPALLDSVWLAALIVCVRIAAIWAGSFAGVWLSDTPGDHGKRMWQTMLTQAGVALGLARMVAARFPDWGVHFQTLMIAVIILNLVIGPPLMRSAIIAVGESKLHGNGHRSEVDLQGLALKVEDHSEA